MIELKHVTFGYNKRQAVLEDINTKIHDGEKCRHFRRKW